MWSEGDKRSLPTYGSTQSRYGSLPATSSPSRAMDSTQRFHQLCDSVSTCIFSINNATALLERAAKQLGTKVDNKAFRDKIHTTQQTSNEAIKTAAVQIRDLATLASSGEKQQRLQSDRLKNEFQDVVRRYSNVQKQVATRQKYTMTLPSPRSPGGGTSGWDGEEDGREQLIDLDQSEIQAQKQVVADLDYENAMLTEREQRIREIEADMLDCNQIFKDLATLVHEQGEVIDTIAGNIETTEHNTGRAVDELRSASQYQAKARKKMCCLAVVLVLVVVILALVGYFTFK